MPRAKPDGVSPLLKPEDGETPMTTETNSVLNSVKEAFAPVTEAFTKLQNLEVPEAAREFVKKQADAAKVRAADAYAGSEKVTNVIESAVAGSVSEAAKISRNIQQALYQDAEAFFAGIDKLASAKSLSEAAQIQSELVRARGEVFVSRAKASSEYLGKLVADGAKTAQDNFSKVYSKTA
jgi:phasin